MGKQCFYLLGNTHYKWCKKSEKGSFNSLLFKLSDDGSLPKKSLMILNSILFLESFSLISFFLSESLLINLIIIIDFSCAFIFL